MVTDKLPSYTDAFGVAVEEGDYIMSAASATYRVKIGRAVFGPASLMMTVEHQNWAGFGAAKREPVGFGAVVLRKADGTVPDHILGVPNTN